MHGMFCFCADVEEELGEEKEGRGGRGEDCYETA